MRTSTSRRPLSFFRQQQRQQIRHVQETCRGFLALPYLLFLLSNETQTNARTESVKNQRSWTRAIGTAQTDRHVLQPWEFILIGGGGGTPERSLFQLLRAPAIFYTTVIHVRSSRGCTVHQVITKSPSSWVKSWKIRSAIFF